MTNSTKMFGLIMTVVLWAGVVAAQSPSTSQWGQESPPELELPLPGIGGPSMPSTPPASDTSGATTDMSGAATQEGAAQPDGQGYEPGMSCDCPDGNGLWNQVAPIESSGTWLQRGFWYAETDAVVLTRIWNRNDKRLAAQDVNVNNPPVNNASLGFNPIFLDTNRLMILNGSLPGEYASVRATLGNFLFRDSLNRDHSVEFTVFGGGDWRQDRQISSSVDNGLFVPFRIDGGNRSFDQSTHQQITYTSDLNSFELNYHVRSRLDQDQLVMDPNGEWHRAANVGIRRDYLAGIRFMQLAENLDWQAQDIVTAGADGSYLIHTDNDLIGFQLGGGVAYQASRWSIGTSVKGGVYLNDALGESNLSFTADNTAGADLRLRENQLSFEGEFQIQGKYHITPNVSLRAGYNIMFITSTALAPNQATFITDYNFLNTTGGPFYHGMSAGLEWYW
jgi:Putative beta barrel porin-7 (BBP7)